MSTRCIHWFLVLALIGLGSCERPPEFQFEPRIRDPSLQFAQGPQVDTLKVKFRFQDGNGDLGLTESDTLPPFQRWNPDSSLNLDHFNLLFFLFVQDPETGDFEPVVFPPSTPPDLRYHGRFPVLQEGESDGTDALEGTIEYFTESVRFPFNAGDSILVEIQIKDRALNSSNKLEIKHRIP